MTHHARSRSTPRTVARRAQRVGREDGCGCIGRRASTYELQRIPIRRSRCSPRAASTPRHGGACRRLTDIESITPYIHTQIRACHCVWSSSHPLCLTTRRDGTQCAIVHFAFAQPCLNAIHCVTVGVACTLCDSSTIRMCCGLHKPRGESVTKHRCRATCPRHRLCGRSCTLSCAPCSTRTAQCTWVGLNPIQDDTSLGVM